MPKPILYDTTHPVALAVEPLRSAAIEAARCRADLRIRTALTALEDAGRDRNVVAPRPDAFSRNYDREMAYYNFLRSITRPTWSAKRPHDPDFGVMDAKGCAKYIEECEKTASYQYDAFTMKLIEKVGPCLRAELSGNHVWSYSILTVQHKGREPTQWKTTEIVNVSKLGKYFPQWPTRKMK